MGIVIPMFIEDEITGLKVPNRPQPESWVVITGDEGYTVGHSCHSNRSEAIQAAMRVGGRVEHWPAIPPYIPKQ